MTAVTRVSSRGARASRPVSAVLTSPMCENACGKLPTSRPSFGSYSSESRPRSLRSASSRSNSSRASSSSPSRTRLSTNQKEQRKNAPSPGGRPSTSARLLVVAVALHEAVDEELAPHRLERAAHARVVRREEADERDREQARVEPLRAVRLHERAELRVEALLEHLGVDLVADRPPALDRPVAARAPRQADRRGRTPPTPSPSSG